MPNCPCYRSTLYVLSLDFAPPLAYLCNKEVGLLPRRKVTASLRLIPIHDLLPVPFAPLSGRIARIAWEPAHANRDVDRPRGRVGLILPIVTSR